MIAMTNNVLYYKAAIYYIDAIYIVYSCAAVGPLCIAYTSHAIEYVAGYLCGFPKVGYVTATHGFISGSGWGKAVTTLTVLVCKR